MRPHVRAFDLRHHHAGLLTALLASLYGWAAWCACLRWEARLLGTDDAHIADLLAVRLAWECLIDDGELVALAERVLRGMSLTRGFARLV